MYDDVITAERQYLNQIKQLNNTKVCIIFQGRFNKIPEIDKLLECLEFGDYKKQINVLNIFDDGQINYNDKQIVIDESKTGKHIHTLIIETPKQYFINEELSRLSMFTKFCPNLVSLHIILDQNHSIHDDYIIELWTNIEKNLDKLREIKFDMKYTMMESQRILEIIKHTSNLRNLLSLSFVFDFCLLSAKDWKLVYSQFNKLKKLNTIILNSPSSIQPVYKKVSQIANRYHKKLVRLVQNNISISNCEYGTSEEEDDDGDDNIGFGLFD